MSDKRFVSFTPKKLFYLVQLKTKEFGGEVIESMYWDRMSLEQHTRWRWYFIYRAALLQVANPRMHVAHDWGTYDPTPKDQVAMYQRRLIARKRKITEWKNKLELAKMEWAEKSRTDLFPIPIEDDEFYQKAVAKIARDEEDLAELKITIANLQK